MTLKRITREYMNFQRDPLDNCSAGPIDDETLQYCVATIPGPQDTPYAGGAFRISIRFPDTYPHVPPQITFSTPIFHPNVSLHGEIRLAELDPMQWCPAFTIRTFLLSLQAMLSGPNVEQGCILNEEAAKLYLNDTAMFEEKARAFTMAHAVEGTALHSEDPKASRQNK